MHDLLLDNGELLVKFQVHGTCVWERRAYSEVVYATTPIATFLDGGEWWGRESKYIRLLG